MPRKRRLRSLKRFRIITLTIAGLLLALGLGLVVAGRIGHNERLSLLSGIYLCAGAVLLILREFLMRMDGWRKRKYRK